MMMMIKKRMMLEEDHPQQGGVIKQLTPGRELFFHNSTSWTLLLSLLLPQQFANDFIKFFFKECSFY